MNKMQKILLGGMVAVILALAVGCAPLARPNPDGNGSSSGMSATPTGMVGGDENTPQATPGDSLTVTLADNGKEITLKQGDRLLVQLGEEYTWQLTNSDMTVLSPVMGVMLVQGAQGLYDAAQPGQSVISGPGDPTCLTAEPACLMPSIEFKVTVNVE